MGDGEPKGVIAPSSSDDRKTLILASEKEDEEVMGLVAAVNGGGTSIAERRAAKFGFNAVKINTARFRTTSPLASPAARSPCLTIPPGISPTALLDSPIMLPNSQALPSPTTGTFPLPSFHQESSILNSATREGGDKGGSAESFRFKPYEDFRSLPRFSTFGNQQTDAQDQAIVLEQSSMGFEFPAEFPGEATTKYCVDSSNDVKILNNMMVDAKCVDKKISPDVTSDQTSHSRKSVHGECNATNDLSEGNQSGSYPSVGMVRTSEDGYNWRKYGQKQVKGSEYPRSYYKCTHPNCQVKKKVERSHDGQITEIIYKGAHNHLKPQPNRRATLGSAFSFDEMSEISEGSGTCLKVEGGSTWTNIQSGSTDIKLGSDGRTDGMEITSSTSVVTELSDPLSTIHGKSIGTIESAETPEPSSTVASHEDDEDGATQGSISLGGDADDEDSEAKRRKKESCLIETNLTSRAVREPRVVVQIESEVDILDDGYRWRKYGQKVVKGNPNPRSYYKCTSAGCSVRKHVERASHNLKCVITTYEGKHNHEVPAARNGNHMNSSGANVPPAANNAQPALTLPRNTNIPKPETHIQDLAPHFDRKPEFNEYLRPSFAGNFSNDVRFGASSFYQMKFPPLQHPIPYTSFGLNPNRSATQQAASVASFVPDFPMSLPMNPTPSGSLVGFDFNSEKSVAPVPPLLSGQQLRENDTRFLRPKQEQNDEILYDACLPRADNANAPSLSSLSSSSVYNWIMRSFPS
ncbi:WRKY domain containing protein [Parasponia andersonii]|uniref:WRKY domain containing protein n=1 Tax=Parasponia andersonii TaxID=3476 RepID=A0A2P5CUG5_PARAD|nr:WRKY domain containing protein [Parasponia andersonii]